MQVCRTDSHRLLCWVSLLVRWCGIKGLWPWTPGHVQEDLDQCILSDSNGQVSEYIFAMLHMWRCQIGIYSTKSVLVSKLESYEIHQRFLWIIHDWRLVNVHLLHTVSHPCFWCDVTHYHAYVMSITPKHVCVTQTQQKVFLVNDITTETKWWDQA